MSTPRRFMTDLPMQRSGAQMNRGAPWAPQTYPSLYMSDHNIGMIQHHQTDHMTWKTQQKHSSASIRLEELEALFSHTMFPDKRPQKEFTLKFNLPNPSIKIWFKNQRVNLRLSLQQPVQALPAQDVCTSSITSTSPHSFPVVSDFCNTLPPQPLGPSSWAWGSDVTESPVNDVQMQDPQLESLVASVPALYDDSYDIDQIMKLYSFPDEEELPDPFYCLYQYLSPTGTS